MNFFKQNKMLVFSIILIVIGIGVLILSFLMKDGSLFSNKKEIKNTASSEHDHVHESYSPDADKDPFKGLKEAKYDVTKEKQDKNPTASVSDFTFKLPVDKTNYLEPNTNSFVLDANNKYVLLAGYSNGYQNLVYVHVIETNENRIAHSYSKDAKLSPDGENVVILSEEMLHTQRFLSYDISLGKTEVLDTLDYDDQATSFTIQNGKIYYTNWDDVTEKLTTKMTPLKEFITKLPPADLSFSYPNSGRILASNSNASYVFLPDKLTLHKLETSNSTKDDIKVDIPDTIDQLLQLDVNDENNYLMVYYDQDKKTKLGGSFGVESSFRNLAKARWYGNEHLLVLDTNTLYLYNIEKKKKEVLKTNISDFFAVNGNIYYQTADGKLFYMERENKK